LNKDRIRKAVLLGETIKHLKTGNYYYTIGLKLARMPDGTWVEAAEYHRVDGTPGDYVRPLTAFEGFVSITDGVLEIQDHSHGAGCGED
jgi:hypothetical protein